jgi:integrase
MRGDGKLYARGNKIYVSGSIDGVFYRKSTGKRVSAATLAWIKKADPLEVLAEILKKENPKLVESNSIEDFGRYVINLTAKKRGKANQSDYIRILEKRIVPFFQKYKFEDIKPLKVVEFLEKMKTEVCGDRARRIKTVLTLIFDHAADNGLIDRYNNPLKAKTVQDVQFDYVPKTSAYDFEETAAILKNAQGWLKVFLDISFKLGVRPGELAAVKWQDIDLETGRIHINRTIYKGEVREIEDHKKNKPHNRVIYLFPDSLKLLKNYYAVRPNDEWVFVHNDGKYFNESKVIVQYYFKPLLESIGVAYKTLYSTRRSYASIMDFAGEELKDIQETIGHQIGSKITKKHYIDPKVLKDNHRMKMASESEQLFKAVIDEE